MNCIYYDSIDSTNEELRKFGEEGAEHGTVVLAASQSAGRGRFGRDWESPKGSGIYFSMLLRPQMPADRVSMLTLVVAYAVTKVLKEMVPGPDFQIKWPNDVLANGKKICGILTEFYGNEEQYFLVAGVGLNGNNRSFPEELKAKATSLYLETEKEWDLKDLAEEICEECFYQIERVINAGDLTPVMEEYEELLVNRDQEILVLDPRGDFSGIARGINERGALFVERENFRMTLVESGEVSIRGKDGTYC